MNFLVSAAWQQAYPTSHAGVLVMHGVTNPPQHPALQARKAALEQDLRDRYTGQDRTALLHDPILHAYDAYYKRFNKTYHVQLQLESILFKGKSLPAVAALVEAMFMAEMDDLLLTAGHDLDALRPPLTLDVAASDDSYTLLRGDAQAARPGDMLIRDTGGILSTIVYGPDQRSQITRETRNAVFTTYAPPGIPAENVQQHLEKIRGYVTLIAPQAATDMLEVVGAG